MLRSEVIAERKVLRTLPEQIAEDLGAQIASGLLAGNERLREVEIAERYGVSRAPVREAIRLLARRGFVDFTPRRGAFAREFSLEMMADLFDITGVLVGLAARYTSVLAPPATLDRVGELVKQVETMSELPECEPDAFSSASWRVALFIGRNCGSPSVASLIDQHFQETAWGTLWRRIIPDFRSQDRRRGVAALNRQRLEALRAGDGALAEQISRDLTREARDQALLALAAQRGLEFDRRRLEL